MEDAVPSSRVIEVESRAIVMFDPCRQSADGGLASDLLRSDLRGASDDSVSSGEISHGSSDRISALAHFAAVEIGSLDGYDLIWAHSIERCDACLLPMTSESYMINGPVELSSDPRWGILCVTCGLQYAPIIGWGRGQLYKRRGTTWHLIAGGPPPDLNPVTRD